MAKLMVFLPLAFMICTPLWGSRVKTQSLGDNMQLSEPGTLRTIAQQVADTWSSVPGEQRYKVKWKSKRLGHGSFGEVWKGKIRQSKWDSVCNAVGMCKDVNEMKIAVKVVKQRAIEQQGLASFVQEIEALKRCGVHPNVVTLVDVYAADSLGKKQENGPFLNMVMQRATGRALAGKPITELWDELNIIDDWSPNRKSEEINWLQERAKLRFTQILDALLFSHQQGIAHRDIKSENVFLDGDDKVLLGDYGFALIEDTNGGWRDHAYMGTEDYVAPELFRCGPVGRRFAGSGCPGYDARAVDLWAMGILLNEMIVGEGPFGTSASRYVKHGEINDNMMKNHRTERGKLPANADPDLRELIEGLLHRTPSERSKALKKSLVAGWLSDFTNRALVDNLPYAVEDPAPVL